VGDEYQGGYVDPHLNVCGECFDEVGIQEFIANNARSKACDFCETEGPEDIAAALEEVITHIRTCAETLYSDPDNAGMGYESAEGGYQGTVWDTYEFVRDELQLELPNDDDEKLFKAICDGLGDQSWSSATPYSLDPDERLQYSWTSFCEFVKHDRRFFFMLNKKENFSEVLTPESLLKTILSYSVGEGLIKIVPIGQTFFRVRKQNAGEIHNTSASLGPPPVEISLQSNRMSPPGIVMMYVSEEIPTAMAETDDGSGTYACGQFLTTREMRILDLVELPNVPSFFTELPDTAEYNPRVAVGFLHGIAEDISRPIARDDRVHVEYVPTQVVTEYFRTIALEDDSKLDGIRFRSSRVPDGVSLVLFADRSNVVGARDGDDFIPTTDEWIELNTVQEIPR
jgi:hypothetical protein